MPMRLPAGLVLVFQGLQAAAAKGGPPAHQTFDVTDFGAVGDGETDDGAAIQSAFSAADQAAQKGKSSTVVLRGKAGTVFALRRPLYFTASNSQLEIGRGVTLRWLFDADLSFLDDGSPHRWPNVRGPNATTGGFVTLFSIGPAWKKPRLRNVTLTGGGTLDGSGHMWWPMVYHKWEFCCAPGPKRRWSPYFMAVTDIDGLRVRNLTVLNPPMITFNGPAACSDVEMSWLNITAPWQTPEDFYGHSPSFQQWRHKAPISFGDASLVGRAGTCGGSIEPNQAGTYGGAVRFNTLFNVPVGLCEPPNTDGIDPGLGSHNVHIHDIFIENGDDSVVIKPGWGQNRAGGHDCTRDVLVERVQILRGMGANIGGMGSGCVQNITFKDITVLPSLGGLEIKTEKGRDSNSFVRDVLYRNVTFLNSINASHFPCLQVHSDYYEQTKVFKGEYYPRISNIRYEDIDLTKCTTPVALHCSVKFPCHNISFSNVKTSGFSCANVENCSAAGGQPDSPHCGCKVPASPMSAAAIGWRWAGHAMESQLSAPLLGCFSMMGLALALRRAGQRPAALATHDGDDDESRLPLTGLPKKG